MTDSTTPNTQHADSGSKHDAINKCIALKSVPHVYEKLKKLWGFPAFFNYMNTLMLVEPGRENRQGFSEAIYKELNALENIFLKFPDEVAHPSLTDHDRREIRQLIKERSIKINYVTGDRR